MLFLLFLKLPLFDLFDEFVPSSSQIIKLVAHDCILFSQTRERKGYLHYKMLISKTFSSEA